MKMPTMSETQTTTAGLDKSATTKPAIKVGKPKRGPVRLGIYGTGGIGKTTMAALYTPNPIVIDLEHSLGRLDLDVPIVDGINTFNDLINALSAEGWGNYDTIVLDSASRAEDMAVEHVLSTIPTSSGQAQSIEDYGYGKGYVLIYETFMKLASLLDFHWRCGRNIVLVMHAITETVPNPSGIDFLRWEPRLQNLKRNTIRQRVKEWLDELCFIGYDIAVKDKTGKATGSGTRTIYPFEQPWCMAKTRTQTQTYAYPTVDGEYDAYIKALEMKSR